MGRKEEIAARIKLARIEAGLSQKELGKLYGTSDVSISEIERGITNIDVASLERLSSILGKPFEWFLSDGVEVAIRPLEVILTEAQNRYGQLGIIELPVRGAVPGDYNVILEERIEGYLPISKLVIRVVNRGTKDMYLLRVEDDTLSEDRIYMGDVLVIDPHYNKFADNKIYVVKVGTQVIARHLCEKGGIIQVVPSTEGDEPLQVSRADILGRVVISGQWIVH